ncbi:MAG: hypothetical protein GWP10_13525 [Nitrospiraceae bacterium]|nr:hypothetical protein [Nitrospiraceae bacterium]
MIKAINKTNIILAICAIALQFYDFYVTFVAIKNNISESNPLLKFFMNYFGPIKALIVFKCLGVFLIFLFFVTNKKDPELVKEILIGVIVFYVLVLGYITICNYTLLFPQFFS